MSVRNMHKYDDLIDGLAYFDDDHDQDKDKQSRKKKRDKKQTNKKVQDKLFDEDISEKSENKANAYNDDVRISKKEVDSMKAQMAE